MIPVLAPAASVIGAVLLAVWLSLGPRPGGLAWLGPLALLFCLAAAVLSALTLVGIRQRSRRFSGIDRAILEDSAGEADLGALISNVHDTGFAAEMPGFGEFLLSLNDDFALLRRSAIKFDLFASDILFSSRNLARQSEAELEMLIVLKKRSEGYHAKLAATARELEDLIQGVAGYASGAESLRGRALGARDQLAEVSRVTSEAATAATGGSSSLAATGVSAASLAKGIAQLDRVAEKQAVDAKRIGEALRVIEDIVERTHVLATNASIEAAHAGTRGAGFAVIAQEIRKLAASSRASLADISQVLGSIAKGIETSARLSSESSLSARELGAAVADSQARFAAIVHRVAAVDDILGAFAEAFSDQIEAASGLAATATEASARIERFGRVFGEGATDYQTIADSASGAEAGAKDARRSSKVLAQLAGYLKIGGIERNKVLKRYRILARAEAARFARKESRQLLLYNLEIYAPDGSFLGYIGDLSRSGMLILAEVPMAANSRHRIRVALPLTSEGERSVELSLEVRRIESDGDGNRIGCRFIDLGREGESAVEELLQTLSIEGMAKPELAKPPSRKEMTGDAEEALELEEL